MPCEPLTDKSGKINGFMCSRTKTKEKPKQCYICGKPSTKLCDFRDGTYRMVEMKDKTIENKDGSFVYVKLDNPVIKRMKVTSLNTCDKPMCDDCSNHIGHDTDFCNEHFNDVSIHKTKIANDVLEEMREKFDL